MAKTQEKVFSFIFKALVYCNILDLFFHIMNFCLNLEWQYPSCLDEHLQLLL